jgi:hypothetical protein
MFEAHVGKLSKILSQKQNSNRKKKEKDKSNKSCLERSEEKESGKQ